MKRTVPKTMNDSDSNQRKLLYSLGRRESLVRGVRTSTKITSDISPSDIKERQLNIHCHSLRQARMVSSRYFQRSNLFTRLSPVDIEFHCNRLCFLDDEFHCSQLCLEEVEFNCTSLCYKRWIPLQSALIL